MGADERLLPRIEVERMTVVAVASAVARRVERRNGGRGEGGEADEALVDGPRP